MQLLTIYITLESGLTMYHGIPQMEHSHVLVEEVIEYIESFVRKDQQKLD